jgi:hypothetical protein
MTKHLTNGLVVVDHLVETVVIPVQTVPQHCRDEYLPQIHARTSLLGVDVVRHNGFQDCKYLFSQVFVYVNVLQADQHGRDIVTRLRVENDARNIRLAQLHLLVQNLTHGITVSKFSGKGYITKIGAATKARFFRRFSVFGARFQRPWLRPARSSNTGYGVTN